MKQENVKNKKENREELVSYIRMGRELSGRQQILLVIQLSLPAIMAQLTSVAMQYIDASMVGRLGSGAAAAIGLVASTTWLFGGVCNSFSVGFAVQAAQLIGANKLEAAKRCTEAGPFYHFVHFRISGCDRYCDQQLSAGLAWRRKGYFKGRRTLFSDLCLLFALFGTECAGRQYAAEQRQYESARYFKFPAVSSGCLV